jgi:hypothetical protein
VYVYYEHHKDSNGKVVLTELRLSSWDNGKLAINFNSTFEKTLFEISKTILKEPPVAYRSYEDSNKIWSYLAGYGESVLQRLQDVTSAAGHKVVCIAVEDLAAQAMNHHVDLSGASTHKHAQSAQDFFYNHGQPAAAPALTKETVAEKLKLLMGDTLDKRAYRQAALRYHPDRNNGDGSKMSELNMLWSVYNG